jgi:hypothetical protein
MKRGLEWTYINQTTLAPFEIPANSHFQLPRDDFTFKYSEGVLIQFSAGFDHSSCGIRIESHPNFDTSEDFTVANLSLGVTRPEILVYALIPPHTPAGLFGLRIVSPWTWKAWLNLYLVNTDDVPHRVLGHTYHMACLQRSLTPTEEGN